MCTLTSSRNKSRSIYPVVLPCVCARGCLSAEVKAKTIGNQIETDFTLYLLALTCDNRLARKSNGKEREQKLKIKLNYGYFAAVLVEKVWLLYLCEGMENGVCVCVSDRECRCVCVCLSMSDDLAHFNLWQGEDVVKTIITFFLSLITAH